MARYLRMSRPFCIMAGIRLIILIAWGLSSLHTQARAKEAYIPKMEEESERLYAKGLKLFNTYQYDSALPYFNELILRLQNHELESEEMTYGIKAENHAGAIHLLYSRNQEAMQYFSHAAYCARKADSSYLPMVLNNIGIVYSRYGAYGKAYELFKESFDNQEEQEAGSADRMLLNMLTMAISMDDEQAVALCMRYWDSPTYRDNPNFPFAINLAKAYMAEKQGKYRESLRYTEKLSENRPLTSDSVDFYLSYYLSISAKYQQLGILDSAMLYNEIAKELAMSRHDYAIVRECSKNQYYIEQGRNLADAVSATVSYWEMSDSISAEEKEKQLANLEYAVRKHQQEQELKQLRINTLHQRQLLKSRNRTLVSILSGFIIVSILLVIVYIQKRKQAHHIRALYEKNKALWKSEQRSLIRQKPAAEPPGTPAPDSVQDTSDKSMYEEAAETEMEGNSQLHLSEEYCQTLLDRILQVFENGTLYLKNTFNLAKLAKATKSNATYVSYTLNEYYGKSFSAMLNEYRIRYACVLIESPDYQNYKIEHIAQVVGYKSKSAFYTAFKKQTGLTPAQYQRASIQQKAENLA